MPELLGWSRAVTVTGVVVSVRAGGEIAVAHDDIAGYMPAMTMPFKLSDSREAAGLAPNDADIQSLK